MSKPPLDENEPGPPRPLSDFMSPEQFAEFNAETRRLKRELAREEEAASASPMRPTPFLCIVCRAAYLRAAQPTSSRVFLKAAIVQKRMDSLGGLYPTSVTG